MASSTPRTDTDGGSAGKHLASVTGDGWLAGLACFARMTVQGTWTNRFQLSLTVITMAIGSLSLALTFFLGEGALKTLWTDVERILGSWVIAADDPGPDRALLRKRPHSYFTEEDLAQVKTELKTAKLVTPVFYIQTGVQYGEKIIVMPLECITPELGNEPPFRTIQGRSMSPETHRGQGGECLVTESAVETLGLRVEDQPTILVGHYPFRVVGVVNDPPQAPDRFRPRVIVPYFWARILWMPPGSVGHILAAWRTPEDMGEILDTLRRTLDRIRGPNTYYLDSTQFHVQSGKKIIYNFMAVGMAQALFCIIVASIGVVNVMLTNVTQRAHEFSVRIAMGARQREILAAVLFESLILGLTGAVIGILAAIAFAPYIGAIMAAKIPGASWLKPYLTYKGFMWPFLVCGLSSLIAGAIPALKVRRMDVLAALRKE